MDYIYKLSYLPDACYNCRSKISIDSYGNCNICGYSVTYDNKYIYRCYSCNKMSYREYKSNDICVKCGLKLIKK
ncbi:ORF MSV022 hypothetical protein [Melanoplus sanguinipes entomopoxvirus]|uniref:Uncharacterized protein n=1 Tax=Melanoplus sanguinipes entomopoxvirus TaxID=83191 RepID=Q9YW70_MSEPV|nr:ORF MSV022 hypothetical protein [Melanoplus sanguinipes entomopoxvirus]AAC97849.1 ORF MSV022 hypothetical protein [Melanoplus sanguinipes entomopoxvirus 'O']